MTHADFSVILMVNDAPRSELDDLVDLVRRHRDAQVELALKKGIDPNGIGRLFFNDGTVYEQRSPLGQACRMGATDLVDTLIAHGARPLQEESLDPASMEVTERLSAIGWPSDAAQRWDAFVAAVGRTSFALMLHHLDQGLDVQRVDPLGRNALHHLTTMGAGDAERRPTDVGRWVNIVQRLIEQGVDVNAVNVDGDTALHRMLDRFQPMTHTVDPSWFEGQAQVVDRLLMGGANVNAMGSQGTPLVTGVSRAQHHPLTVARLRARGARLEYPSTALERTSPGSALLAAVYTGVHDLVQQALDLGEPVNQPARLPGAVMRSRSMKMLPLQRAVSHGQTELIDLLLHAGADPMVLVNSPAWSDLEQQRARLRSQERSGLKVSVHVKQKATPAELQALAERQAQAIDRIEGLALRAQAQVQAMNAAMIDANVTTGLSAASRPRVRL